MVPWEQECGWNATVFCAILLSVLVLLKSSHLNLVVRDFGRTEDVFSGVKG